MASPDNEIVLKGGRANTGNVVRIGDQVARPSYPQTQTVDHFLRFLVDSGASFVPQPIGSDDQGRQRLSYIAGTAPSVPYPAWAFDEGLMIALAQRQRELHQLAVLYQPPSDAVWAVSAGDYFPAAAITATPGNDLVVCHNDLGMTNVIVNESHQLVGLIDFDYCRPVNRLFDITVAVRHWAPFGDLDIVDAPSIDRVRRFGLFCDVHELTIDDRAEVVALAITFLEQARRNIKALARAGGVGFQALLANGYEETNQATVTWLKDHAENLADTGPAARL